MIDINKEIINITTDYICDVRKELDERWKIWPKTDLEINEVIGGIMARQVSLATQLAYAPQIWNGHIAPIILRTMIDNYIQLAWIFKDPKDRCKKFIAYGLGQEKLTIEQMRSHYKERGEDRYNDIIKKAEFWLNIQKYERFIEVDIGSLTNTTTRKMAEDANCVGLHKFPYTSFSGATHNAWNHIAKYNLYICDNPLHGQHRVPIDPDLDINLDYLYRAAKYVDMMFNFFDEKTGIDINIESSFKKLEDRLKQLGKDLSTLD